MTETASQLDQMLEGGQIFSEAVHQFNATTENAAGSDVPAVNCTHRNKKGLFKPATLRRKLKARLKRSIEVNYCDNCPNLTIEERQSLVWVCVTCSHFGCEENRHSLNHFKETRSGMKHPLYFAIENQKFRCLDCAKDFHSSEEESGPMKTFVNDYNSFMKTVSKVRTGESQSIKGGNIDESSLSVEDADIKRKCVGRRLSNNKVNTDEKSNQVVPIKGLVNLGNTCFFNSITQCLLHTHTLSVYIDLVGREDSIELMSNTFLIGDKEVKVPHVHLPLGSFNGPLNKVFANFLRDFKAGKTVNPLDLFTEISKRAPRFRGWSQQDAHELLRYLLDGLRTEELTRYKEAITRYIKTAKDENQNYTDEYLALLTKGMLKACGRPLIDAVFGGTLLQTVKCCECGHLSKTYEDFLDLSLPLPSTSTKSLFNGQNKMHKSASLTLSKHQKKKEKLKSRKGRRKSHEIISRNNEVDCSADCLDNSDEEIDGNYNTKNPCGNDYSEMDKINKNFEDDNCLQSLGSEKIEENGQCSLTSCLRAFTATEYLLAPNTYECEKCCVPHNKQLRNGMKKRTVEAEKRYLIYEPPPVLTLHIKRFEQTHLMSGRVQTRKVGGKISFPLILNIAPYCTQVAKRIGKGLKKVNYALYGIVSHSGDLSSGHYVAHIRNRPSASTTEKFFYEAANLAPPDPFALNTAEDLKENNGIPTDEEWFFASDLHVSPESETSVYNVEGYILFYERIC
ncbi:unnamed protein product [Thelazia callipaeda]|uniref:ubiquitinyl hydrolase 1 n=1 Tax=Thelazia callipaeda TaxID=103827 RepID=A0A0N5CM54_THECL|nr:unnamed protein product [Thelazia callipaeda]